MNWKVSFYIMYFSVWGGLLCVLLAYAASMPVLYGLAGILIAGGIAQSRKFYICPHCDEVLPSVSVPKSLTVRMVPYSLSRLVPICCAVCP